MRFRPCIDLHAGKVKQIVGSTLCDAPGSEPETNFESAQPPAHYARLYRRDGLVGGHVIMLGPGNEQAAEEALRDYPGGLQVGGGIGTANAATWLEKGADKVIVTSAMFESGRFAPERLEALRRAVGRERMVLDLSCREHAGVYRVMADRWQTVTDLAVDAATLERLAMFCAEFLVHAVAVEGRRQGVDTQLIAALSRLSPLPVVYAGGVRDVADLDVVDRAGGGRVDVTVGSALDIFGGTLPYRDVVAFDHARRAATSPS